MARTPTTTPPTHTTPLQTSIAALCVACGTAAFAQPVNDTCATAAQLSLGDALSGTTIGAGGVDMSTCAFGDSNDVWYVYRGLDSGFVTFSTCGSALDTTIAIYDTCNGNELGCNGDSCGTQSEVTVSVNAGIAVYVRIAGENGSTGTFTISAEPATTGGTGPDVTLGDIHNVSHYGPVGSVHAYSIGSKTCNIGTADLGWGGSWDGSPQLAMNMFSIVNGRLTQIGQGWAKTGCCAAAVTDTNACGPVTCNGNGGSVLGAGCRDTYGSGWNGIQGNLGPRSQINPYTGVMADASPGSFPLGTERRLQVDQSKMPTSGALYFVEGVYVGVDDAPAGNWYNNASYRRATVSPGSYALTLQDSTQATVPAIYAWKDHGLGANQADPSVNISNVDVPGEGRFISATKVTDLGNGNHRYDYAVYNLNSDRSGGSFTVPIPAGLTPTNIGFNDVDYHSGEPFDNTDWTLDTGVDYISWECPETFQQNQNTNALRWGTMYNFWFEIDAAPEAGQLELGLFKPGSQAAVNFSGSVPAVACACETGGNPAIVEIDDLLTYLVLWFALDPAAERTGDATITSSDLLEFLACWFAASGATCP